MSTKAVDWALSLALSPGAKLVLVVLAHRADDQGHGRINRQKLADLTGLRPEDAKAEISLLAGFRIAHTLADEYDYELPAAAAVAQPLSDNPEFDAWYGPYPRKVGRAAALRAFEKTIKRGTPLEMLVRGLNRSIADWRARGTTPEYIPHPATWLNQARWMDSPPASIKTADINTYVGR